MKKFKSLVVSTLIVISSLIGFNSCGDEYNNTQEYEWILTDSINIEIEPYQWGWKRKVENVDLSSKKWENPKGIVYSAICLTRKYGYEDNEDYFITNIVNDNNVDYFNTINIVCRGLQAPDTIVNIMVYYHRFIAK